ncbi:TatD family hydrolase [Thioflexithrix psekupsensis]|uniref:DNAase n=1 Tax=Thioflexithrix psekupsensis TaxID=1570016 RepID=A0A251X6B0_9GAMM|nr:TatD family hydrolase [Thioflexithrix psekupsensis]OUD12904.1 DNAase [Thioflexithrix psekupsensis]
MSFLIDSHCHFDDVQFDADRELALQRAHAVGVKAQVLPAVTAALWPKLKEICEFYPNLFPAYGLHPIYLAQHDMQNNIKQLADYLTQNKAVAIGECGLDFYLKELDEKQQITLFLEQLYLAQQYQLPVIIHARRATDKVLYYLRKITGIRGVLHSFIGSEQQAWQLIDLGYYFSVGGPVTYPRAQRLRALIKILPLERLLVETDAPDQPLCGRQGQRNEPAYLPDIVAMIAQLRQQSFAEIATASTKNAIDLFRLPLSHESI